MFSHLPGVLRDLGVWASVGLGRADEGQQAARPGAVRGCPGGGTAGGAQGDVVRVEPAEQGRYDEVFLTERRRLFWIARYIFRA